MHLGRLLLSASSLTVSWRRAGVRHGGMSRPNFALSSSIQGAVGLLIMTRSIWDGSAAMGVPRMRVFCAPRACARLQSP